jgi:hypothetical protein
MDNLYVMWPEQLAKIKEICDRLHSGSDAMRDQGHRLWLVLNEVKDQQVETVDAKEIH